MFYMLTIGQIHSQQFFQRFILRNVLVPAIRRRHSVVDMAVGCLGLSMDLFYLYRSKSARFYAAVLEARQATG